VPGRVVNVKPDYCAVGVEVHIHPVGNLTGGGSGSRVKFYIQAVGSRLIVDFHVLSLSESSVKESVEDRRKRSFGFV